MRLLLAFALWGSWARELEALPAAKTRVYIHKEAEDWDLVSVQLVPGGMGRNSFERQVRKLRAGGYRGVASPATSVVRSHPAGEDRWLIVSVYPQALRFLRKHVEARFFIQEGYLERVQVAAVSVAGAGALPEYGKDDSFTLRAKGVDFSELYPGSAEIELSVINPGPGRAANAGRVKNAAFGDIDLQFVNFSWSATEVLGKKPAPARKPAPVRR